MDNRLHPLRLPQRLLSYLICAIIAWQPLLPAMSASINPANGNTQMDKAGNGVPVVNIATPNNAGISHNQFSDYNVDKQGLILNNATGQLTPTQLGGLIQNNGNLTAGREAQGIINEVVGANRSQLQGYTEVAGKAANVMVANPYGITCNGCGFINTPNATLTTGKPTFDSQGNLQALTVSKGSITIEGQGLDASQSDALAIISRATEVNAAIHARDLKIIAGANRVAADGSVTAIAGEGAAPRVAVDTGALGGMYANRIHLISSEKGVGVNLGNLHARQGDMVLDASGKLALHNTLTSGALSASGESVALSGDNKATGTATVTAQQGLTLKNGKLVADKGLTLNGGQRVQLSASQLTSGEDIRLAAGELAVDSGSAANAGRDIAINAQHGVDNAGQLTAAGNIAVQAATLDNSGALIAKGQLQSRSGQTSNQGKLVGAGVNIDSNALNNRGEILAGEQLNITAATLQQSGTLNAKGQTRLKVTEALENAASGTISGDSQLQIAAGMLSNKGTLFSQALSLESRDIVNGGLLQGAQSLSLLSSRLDNQAQGSIYTAGDLSLSLPEFSNSGLVTSDAALHLSGDRLDNHGEINAASLTADNRLLNNGANGAMLAQGAMQLNHEQLDNAGKLAAERLDLHVDLLNNAGNIQGSGALRVQGNTLNNLADGALLSGGRLTLNASQLDNEGALQGDQLTLTAGDLRNAGHLMSEQDAQLKVAGTLHNSGKIVSQHAAEVEAATLANSGWLVATALALKGDLVNSGLLQGDSSLKLQGDSLLNHETGQLLSGGNSVIDAASLDNRGILQADEFTIRAQQWSNSGTARASRELDAQLCGKLDNSGTLVSSQALDLQAEQLVNSGSLAADRLHIRTSQLINDGLVQGSDALALDTVSIDNLASGQLLSGAGLSLNLETLNNLGLLQVNDALSLQARQFSNGGKLLANNLNLLVSDRLLNQQSGQLLARQDAVLHAQTLNNSGIVAAQDLTLSNDTLTNGGVIQADNALSAQVKQLENHSQGTLLSGGAMTLTGGSVVNAGNLQGNSLAIEAESLRNQGSVLGVNQLDATIGDTLVNSGTLLSGGDLLATITSQLTNSGELMSHGAAQLNAQTLVNSGSLLSSAAITLDGETLTNSGNVQGKTLTITPAQIVNRGKLIGLQALTLARQIPALIGLARVNPTSPDQQLINESGGMLLTQGTLNVNGGSVTNNGSWQGQEIVLNAQHLTNNGAIQSAGDLQLLLTERLDAAADSKITASGSAALQALALTNQGEWIASQLRLTGATLDNNGSISGVQGLTADLSGALTQQQNSKLLSGGALDVNAASVNNQGSIQGDRLHIDSGVLDNSGSMQGDNGLTLALTGNLTNAASGTMLSQNALTLSTPNLINYGLIQGGASSTIKTTSSARNEGRLLNGGLLTLTAPQLTNAGWLQAAALVINAASATNTGTLLAEQQGTLSGVSLTNQGAIQGADLAVNYQQLTNNGSLLGNNQLNVTATQVTQQAAGKLFSGGNLLLNSNGFDQLGQVVALGDVTLKLVNAFTGRGTLAAGNRLTVSSNGNLVNNGVMQGQGLTLTAGGALTNNGQLTSGAADSSLSGSQIAMNAAGSLQGGGNVALTSRGDITLSGFTGTRGTLTLTAPGTILNTALLYAGNHLWLLANSIKNQRGDILAGNNLWMQRDAAGNASAEVINSSGTIETQNGDISIHTGYLLNTREGLKITNTTQKSTDLPPGIGGGVIDVRLGDLAENELGYNLRIRETGGSEANGAGKHEVKYYTLAPNELGKIKRYLTETTVTEVAATGGSGRIASGRNLDITATMLDNQASTILADKSITLRGGSLNNASWLDSIKNTYLSYQFDGQLAQYKLDKEHGIFYFSQSPATTNSSSRVNNLDSHVTYRLANAPEYETIQTGGNFRSVIQGGAAVNVSFSSDISNTSTDANAGGVSNSLSAPALNVLNRKDISGIQQKQQLNTVTTVAVDSPQWRDQLQDALQSVNGGGVLESISNSGLALNNQDKTQKTAVSIGNGVALVNSDSDAGKQLQNMQGNKVDTSAYPLPSGNNGYFVPSTDPKSPYIITTNPKLDGLGQLDQNLYGDLYKLLGQQPAGATQETRSQYTNANQFIGSAYLLERLKLNPEYDYRFLGDAAFDTRYVSNTVLEKSGNRYLSGIGSELDQMRYLLDNAANAQQSLGLELGISLTAAQIAALDHSIIWWEATAINGETVMVPKVYLSPKDITVNNGSVIAGNNLTLSAGSVANNNSSLIAASDLTVNSQNSISNLNDALVRAGGNLQLSALGDIDNIGSAISGKTVALESVNGSINNMTEATQWQLTSSGNRGEKVSLSHTYLGSGASIVSLDSLTLNAGKDIAVTGAEMKSAGDLLINAGGDFVATANTLHDSQSQSGLSDNWRTRCQTPPAPASRISQVLSLLAAIWR